MKVKAVKFLAAFFCVHSFSIFDKIQTTIEK